MPMKSKKMNAKMLKSLALKSGVDLCGIAPVERFRGAPEGFRPTDIYPSAKSVLVFANRNWGQVYFLSIHLFHQILPRELSILRTSVKK